MNKKSILFISGLVFLTMTIAGCNKQSKNSFTISWCNYDGTLIEKDLNVEKGTMPSFDSSKPVKADDASSYYVFSGCISSGLLGVITGTVIFFNSVCTPRNGHA